MVGKALIRKPVGMLSVVEPPRLLPSEMQVRVQRREWRLDRRSKKKKKKKKKTEVAFKTSRRHLCLLMVGNSALAVVRRSVPRAQSLGVSTTFLFAALAHGLDVGPGLGSFDTNR